MAEPSAASVRFGTLAAVVVAWAAPVTLVRTDAAFLLVAAAVAWQLACFGWRRWDGALLTAAAAVAATHALAAFVAEGRLAVPRIAAPMLVLAFCAHLRVGPAVGPAIAASAWIWSLVGLASWAAFHLDWLGASDLARPNSNNLPGFARVAGVMSSNSLVLYLGLALPWIVHGRWAEQRPRGRVAALAVVLVAACGTLSRGLVSVFVALAAPLRGAESNWSALPRAFRMLAVAGLLALGPVTWWALAPPSKAGRLQPLFAGLVVRDNAYLVLHEASLRLWAERPLTGHGPGRFTALYGRVTTEHERAAAWPPVLPGIMEPHSLLLGALAETGLLGFGAWLGLGAVVLRRLFSAPAGSPAHALGFAVVGLAVAGLHMDFQSLRSVWALIGLGLAAARYGEPC